MNLRQRIVLGLTLAVLAWWAASFAPYTPCQEERYPPPRHPLFLPGQPPSQELNAGRAAVEVLFIAVFGGGLVWLVADRRPKGTQ